MYDFGIDLISLYNRESAFVRNSPNWDDLPEEVRHMFELIWAELAAKAEDLYSEGYSDGEESANSYAFDDGLEQGYEEGYEEGHNVGYQSGYEAAKEEEDGESDESV